MKTAQLCFIAMLFGWGLPGGVWAQDIQPDIPLVRPRPYFYGGLQLDGNGSAVFDYVVGAGIQENAQHFVFDGFAEYSNTRKIDDNTVNNHSGRTRLLYGAPRYRFSNRWFVGGGARWSELSTTNYVKQSWHPFVGGGKDWDCCRVTLDYLWMGAEHVDRQGCPVPNGQCTNGTKGVDFQMFLPSPAARSHVLLRMDFLPFWFHTTVTSTDPELTRQQMSETGVGSVLQYTLLFRY
jgi:hypothetical protein